MQDIEEAELLELRSFGVPVVSKKRLRDPSRVPSFGETEAFLAAALTQSATTSQSEPDVDASSSVPSEQQDPPSDSSADAPLSDNSEKAETKVVTGLERLEAFACSACYRSMERDDDLICLIGHRGKYAVRRNAFTIGCIVPPMAAIHRDAATEPPSHIGRSKHLHSMPSGDIGPFRAKGCRRTNAGATRLEGCGCGPGHGRQAVQRDMPLCPCVGQAQRPPLHQTCGSTRYLDRWKRGAYFGKSPTNV